MTITAKHLRDICLLGSQDNSLTCRYLKNDELEEGKWYCQKLQPLVKKKIDKEVSEMKKHKGNKPFSGDNCEGFPLLKHVQQGYDVTS